MGAFTVFSYKVFFSLKSLLMLLVTIPNNIAESKSGGIPLVNNFISVAYSGGGTNRSIIDFYVRFDNYLSITSPLYNPLRWIVAAIGKFFYTVNNALEFFYVKLFSLFNLNGSRYQNTQIHDWYTWSQSIGFTAFIITFLIFLFGTIFLADSNEFNRIKNVIYNFALGSFFVFALPAATNYLASGMEQFANNALNVSNTSSQIDKLSDDIFYSNVYSLSHRLLSKSPGDKVSLNDKSYLSDKKPFLKNSVIGQSINTTPITINLEAMSPKEQNLWNGLRSTTVNSFLNSYGTSDVILSKDRLDQLQELYKTTHEQKDKKNSKGAVDDVQNTVNNKIQDIKGLFGQSDKDKFGDIFKYYISGVGDTAFLTQFSQFKNGVHILPKSVYNCYAVYKVNWFNIILGLATIFIVLVGFIIKLITNLYKAIVMYATAALNIDAHTTQGEKVKNYIRNYFGLFELMVIDVVMLRLWFVAYHILNGFILNVLYHNPVSYSSGSLILTNPLTVGVLRFIVDLALFYGAMQGVDSVSNIIGQPTGNTQGILTSLLAMRTFGGGIGTISNGTQKVMGSVTNAAKKGINKNRKKPTLNDFNNDGVGKPKSKTQNKSSEEQNSDKQGKENNSNNNLKDAEELNKADTDTSTINRLGQTVGRVAGFTAVTSQAGVRGITKGINKAGDTVKHGFDMIKDGKLQEGSKKLLKNIQSAPRAVKNKVASSIQNGTKDFQNGVYKGYASQAHKYNPNTVNHKSSPNANSTNDVESKDLNLKENDDNIPNEQNNDDGSIDQEKTNKNKVNSSPNNSANKSSSQSNFNVNSTDEMKRPGSKISNDKISEGYPSDNNAKTNNDNVPTTNSQSNGSNTVKETSSKFVKNPNRNIGHQNSNDKNVRSINSGDKASYSKPTAQSSNIPKSNETNNNNSINNPSTPTVNKVEDGTGSIPYNNPVAGTSEAPEPGESFKNEVELDSPASQTIKPTEDGNGGTQYNISTTTRSEPLQSGQNSSISSTQHSSTSTVNTAEDGTGSVPYNNPVAGTSEAPEPGESFKNEVELDSPASQTIKPTEDGNGGTQYNISTTTRSEPLQSGQNSSISSTQHSSTSTVNTTEDGTGSVPYNNPVTKNTDPLKPSEGINHNKNNSSSKLNNGNNGNGNNLRDSQDSNKPLKE